MGPCTRATADAFDCLVRIGIFSGVVLLFRLWLTSPDGALLKETLSRCSPHCFLLQGFGLSCEAGQMKWINAGDLFHLLIQKFALGHVIYYYYYT